MKKLLCSSLLLASLTMAQQVPAAASTWPILEAATQSQCSWLARDAAARVFENAAQWQSVFPASQNQALTRTPAWGQEAVVALTLGARATSGFAVELLDKQFILSDDTLRLRFKERKPAAGEILQQVLTQPCVFILTQRGKWRHVVFRDADTGAEFPAALLPGQ